MRGTFHAGQDLRIVVKIAKGDSGGYTAVVYSIDQGGLTSPATAFFPEDTSAGSPLSALPAGIRTTDAFPFCWCRSARSHVERTQAAGRVPVRVKHSQRALPTRSREVDRCALLPAEKPAYGSSTGASPRMNFARAPLSFAGLGTSARPTPAKDR